MTSSEPFYDSEGNQGWRNKNWELHRKNGPAIIYVDGREVWYRHGKRHRENGPAYTNPDGTRIWFENDLCHRLDGPAYISNAGRKEWHKEGTIHRLDGPAVVNDKTGLQEYWVNGKQYSTTIIEHLTPILGVEEAINFNVANPTLNHAGFFVTFDTEEELNTLIHTTTGWDPNIEPTQQQLDTWRVLTGLIIPSRKEPTHVRTSSRRTH